MTTRVAVVGGGLAGLTAAVAASRSGADVRLYEARSEVGGRARSTTAGAFTFNQGAHALYKTGRALEVLRGFGIEPAGGEPDIAKSFGVARSVLGRLPAGPITLLRSPWVTGRGKLELGTFMAKLSRMKPAGLAGRSFGDWVDAEITSEEVRRVVRTVARTSTYSAEFDHLDAGAALAGIQGGMAGVLYLDGGWEQLVSALRKRTTSIDHAKVDRIEHRGAQWAVHSDDNVFTADAIVLANGGPAAADRLVDGRSTALSTWVTECRPVRAACLDVGMRSLPVPDHRVVLGLDEPLYLSVHTPAAKLVQGSGELMHLVRYLTHADDHATADSLRAELESFADLAQPGWRDHAAETRFERALVVSHRLATVGSVPPTVRVPDLDGVFVAGDWVGPHQLADAAVGSGFEAGTLAAEVNGGGHR
jgi:phytoene dehydrogenase-like protein